MENQKTSKKALRHLIEDSMQEALKTLELPESGKKVKKVLHRNSRKLASIFSNVIKNEEKKKKKAAKFMLESSRVFAERLTKTGGNAHAQISSAFRSILCRNAREKELSILTSYYDDELKEFQADPEKAKQAIHVGEYKPIDGVDAPTVAALMQVIHTMYNMEEAITKN